MLGQRKKLCVLTFKKRGIMKCAFLSIAAFLVFISGCKKDDNPADPALVGSISGLTSGKTWMYAWSATDSDTAGQVISTTTDTVSVRVASTDDTLGSYQHLIRLDAQSIPRPRGIARLWYQLAGNSLVEIAYSNVGASPIAWPKRSAQSALETMKEPPVFSLWPKTVIALVRSQGLADSILFRDEARVVYEFPLSVGKTWTSFTVPFLQIREVVGAETVECAGKSYECAKIKTTDPTVDPTMEFFDYISSEGLVKRQVKLSSIVSFSDNPDGPGQTVSVSESLVLISN
jgi:hypothetical protein